MTKYVVVTPDASMNVAAEAEEWFLENMTCSHVTVINIGGDFMNSQAATYYHLADDNVFDYGQVGALYIEEAALQVLRDEYEWFQQYTPKLPPIDQVQTIVVTYGKEFRSIWLFNPLNITWLCFTVFDDENAAIIFKLSY